MSRSMNFDVTARDSASREFLAMAQAAERLEDKLRRLDQLTVNPSAQLNITSATRSAQQLQTRLDALRNVRATVAVDGAAEARREVTALVVEMRKIRNTTATVDVRTGNARADVTAIADKLRLLRDTRVRVAVDTGAAVTAVRALETRLAALRNGTVRVQVDLGSSDTRLRTIEARLAGLASMSPVRVEIRVDETNRALARIAAIRTAALALSNARPNIQVTADTAAALAQMTALLAQVRRLSQPEHQIRIRLEETSVLSQLARIQTELRTLAGGTLEITADTRAAMTQLANLRVQLAELQASEPTVQVRADTAAAQTQIAMLEARLAAIAGEQYTANVRVEVDKDGKGLAGIAKVAASLAGLGAAAGLATASLGGTGAAVLTLGGSVVALTGVLGLLPAAGLAAGAAIGTLVIGLNGLGDALGPTGTAAQIEKVNAAMARLSPAARDLVTQLRALGPAWTDTRLGVQEQLLAGIGSQVQRLGGTYLPVLKTGLGGIATELNTGARMWADWAGQGPQVASLNTILGNTRTALRELAPAGTNVAAALTDISVVGSEIMPELAAGATAATERFREFIAEARRTRELEEWIRGGLETMRQLGSVVGNTGSILGSMFRAAKDSGADFLTTLDRVTGSMATFLRSTEGQSAMVDFFREARSAIDGILPGLAELGRGALDAVQAFANTGGLTAFGAAFTSISERVAPLLQQIGELAGSTLQDLANGAVIAGAALQPIISGVSLLLDGLGPLPGLVLASVVAFKGLAVLAAPLATLATTIAGLSIATGWGAASTAVMGLSTALGAVARALPLVGVAAIAVGFAMDGLTTSTSEAVDVMSRGGRAAAELEASLLAQQQRMEQNIRVAEELDGSLVNLGPTLDELGLSVKRWVQENIFGIATLDSVNAAMAEQRAGMTALQVAQQDLTIAQSNYALAVEQHTANSPQARDAALVLAGATNRVALEQIAARNATDLHTAAMIAQSDQALAATNASLGYDRALITLEQAQIRAAAAARDHGAGSLEARDAALAVEEAAMRAAAAAGEKARADGVAANASNVDEIASRAQKDELLRLAEANTGPVRQSLLDAAAAIDIQASASFRAESLARAHKDELGRLAGQATGPLAQAMRDAAAGFDQLGGAHATAQERARLQEQALRNLANMASGQLRNELNAMADQLRNIPDAEFEVTATGRGKFAGIPSGVSTPGRLATGGVWGGPGDVRRAATGTVLPGYTPGRDVHSFTSATGGRLELSGGEAVMRPEWTRAVGTDFINAANQAARSGGLAGVQDFMARTAPRKPGVEGRAGDGSRFARGGITPTRYTGPVQRLAFGGLVRLGLQPMSAVVNNQYVEARDRMADYLTPLMQAQIKKMEAAALAASGSGPTTAGAAAALAWGRTQVGKPYVWGGVGPGGYDCCLIGETRVYGPDGATPISEIRAGHRVFSHVDGQVQVHTVTAAWQSETQPVFRVRTRNRSVIGSANHPFLVLRMVQPSARVIGGRPGEQTPSRYDVTWARLDELRRGDLVVQPREMQAGEKPAPVLADGTVVDTDVAWLIGATVGDGTVTPKGLRLALFGAKRDRANDIITGYWGSHPTYRDDSGLVVSSVALRDALDELGMRRLGPDKRVPDEVWTWPEDLRRAFLDGYADADGHRPADQRKHGERTYASAARPLIDDIRAMHIMLGDPVSNVSTSKRTKPITIRGKLVRNARDLHVFTVWAGPGRGEAAVRRRPGIAAWLDAGDFTVARVLAVDPQGVQQTWDIEVEGAHNFVADGVVVHNSGFMSALVNVMRGRNPHSRVGATGTFPWGGFAPGIGPGLNIGSFRGNPGHMAGTIGGVNVESSGGVGVRVGGGARGAGNSMFTTRAHLADRGGLVPSGMAALNLSGRAERMLSPRQTEVFERLVAAITRGRGNFAAGSPLPVATPIGAGGNPFGEQLRAAMLQPRPTAVGGPRIDLGGLARELSALRADLRDRPQQVINQTVEGGSDPTEVGRTAVLALRLARR